MLQHGWTLKRLCLVKEVRHKRINPVWFRLYEAPRVDKFIKTKSINRTEVTRGWGEEKWIVTAHVQLDLTPYGLWPSRLLCPWNFWGKNTGVGCYFLQGIFPTQIKPTSLASPTLAGGFFTTSATWEKWKWKSLSRVRLFATPWTIQSVEFSRPEYRSG